VAGKAETLHPYSTQVLSGVPEPSSTTYISVMLGQASE